MVDAAMVGSSFATVLVVAASNFASNLETTALAFLLKLVIDSGLEIVVASEIVVVLAYNRVMAFDLVTEAVSNFGAAFEQEVVVKINSQLETMEAIADFNFVVHYIMTFLGPFVTLLQMTTVLEFDQRAFFPIFTNCIDH